MTSVYIGDLVEAHFVERVNRFLCTVVLDGHNVKAHLHDPGRLRELLLPHARVLLREENSPHRKTKYDLVGIYTGQTLVSCDSRVPNRLIKKALEEKALPEFSGYTEVIPEYKHQNSRIDFCLDHKTLIEVKGATLVENGLALFPDAPTERGRKHVQTLIDSLYQGFSSNILFVIQRPDAYKFSPNKNTDPEFADLLSQAAEKGVAILVYISEFKDNYMHLREKISLIEL